MKKKVYEPPNRWSNLCFGGFLLPAALDGLWNRNKFSNNWYIIIDYKSCLKKITNETKSATAIIAKSKAQPKAIPFS